MAYNPLAFKNDFSAFGKAGDTLGSTIAGLPAEQRAENAEGRRKSAEAYQEKMRPLKLAGTELRNTATGLGNDLRKQGVTSGAIDLENKEFSNTPASEEDYNTTRHILDQLSGMFDSYLMKNPDAFGDEEARAYRLGLDKASVKLPDTFRTRKELYDFTDKSMKAFQGMVTPKEEKVDPLLDLKKKKLGAETAYIKKKTGNVGKDKGSNDVEKRYSKAIVDKEKLAQSAKSKLNTFKKALGNLKDKNTTTDKLGRVKIGETEYSIDEVKSVIQSLENDIKGIDSSIDLLVKDASEKMGKNYNFLTGVGLSENGEPTSVKKLTWNGIPVAEVIKQIKVDYKDNPEKMQQMIEMVQRNAK